MRDLEDIQNGRLPVYGKAVSPLGPYRQGPGEMNVPVVCGGQVVMPGDILVGDRDGIVVIPRQEAAELLEAARKNLQDEQEAMAGHEGRHLPGGGASGELYRRFPAPWGRTDLSIIQLRNGTPAVGSA